jgi:hypothetical protein
MPTPFGWSPPDFWLTVLVLGGWAVLMAIAWPISQRWWNRTDRAERERVAMILQELAAEMGGEFIGPREVRGVGDDGEAWGPVLDHGTASVTSSGLVVEACVQPLGAQNSKCLKLWIAVPAGRSWAVPWLDSRAFHWSLGDPHDLLTFRLSYRSTAAERLSREARAALVDVLRHSRDVRLDTSGLTVWALPPRWRASPSISGLTDAAALVPHVQRAAAAAHLLLGH